MKAKGVSDSKGLLKPIYVFIDELADLMLLSRYEVEESITRLAQKGRACGIHLIVATQRPTANVLTGLIKANMPCKIALKVSSVRDSVVALDHKGAEQLLGFGDAIIKVPYSTEETRFQCAYVSKQKIQELIEMRKEN
jgi:S-DNA-T family DNA segregation ATPase FtsK/SpoIIIE